MAAPLLDGVPPQPVGHRSWADEWVVVRCGACGLDGHWPQPELGCPCGTLLRIPVRSAERGAGLAAGGRAARARDTPRPAAAARRGALPRATAAPRPSFRPVTIRTARDAVTAAALYLRWLGFHGVVTAETRPESGIDLRGPEVLAQVDPTTSRTTRRSVECLWLYGLSEWAIGVMFSLAGYTEDALASAGGLGVPLFVMDLTGTPRPVNSAADALISDGA